MGNSKTGHIMTLANSIIGVGILAMPFCFQKCGVILSLILLVLTNLITRISCHYLVKSSILCRRKSMEVMASYIFGSSGKLMVELCIIGQLMGTCVAYFVVVGDLGPQIVSKIFDINHTDTLRTWVMVLVTISCVIPLGLLRNVDSLTTVCAASIGFYICLVIKVIADAKSQIEAGDWINHVEMWNVSGVLQCLPIFSLALSCQMVIFEVYESVPNVSLEKMNEIIKSAINICTGVYILVGFFGYVAFSQQQFSGNILINFEPTFASDVIKIGFVISVAFSFPLIIFPCRSSLYSLIYSRGYSDIPLYIPEHRFKLVTISIVVFALLIGILIPSIELIIGLVGSTIGVAICIMFPASCFIKTSKRNSTEKLLAQILLVFGFLLMVLGTYANLMAIDKKTGGATLEEVSPNLVKPIEYPNINSMLKLFDNRTADLLNENPKKGVEIVKQSPVKEINLEEPNIGGGDPIKIIEIPKLSDVTIAIDSKTDKIVKVNKKKKKPNENGVINESDINKDAILREEQEIAIEKDEIKQEIVKLEKRKELLEEQVEEMQYQISKQNDNHNKQQDDVIDKDINKSIILPEPSEINKKPNSIKKSKDVVNITNIKLDPINPVVDLLKKHANNVNNAKSDGDQKTIPETITIKSNANVPLSLNSPIIKIDDDKNNKADSTMKPLILEPIDKEPSIKDSTFIDKHHSVDIIANYEELESKIKEKSAENSIHLEETKFGRDLLNTNDNKDSTNTEINNKSKREKRNTENENQENCVSTTKASPNGPLKTELNILSSLPSLPNPDLSGGGLGGSNINTKLFVRELKSVEEEDNNTKLPSNTSDSSL